MLGKIISNKISIIKNKILKPEFIENTCMLFQCLQISEINILSMNALCHQQINVADKKKCKAVYVSVSESMKRILK